MKAILVILCLLSAGLCWGQKEVLHQKQIWYKYNLKIPLGDKWQLRHGIHTDLACIFVDAGRVEEINDFLVVNFHE